MEYTDCLRQGADDLEASCRCGDPCDPARIGLRTDVIHHGGGDTTWTLVVQQHCHPAAERRADNDCLFDPEGIEQLPQVLGILPRMVVAPFRIMLGLATAAKIGADDAPRLADPHRQRREIAAVARQAGQTQHGRSRGRIRVVTAVETHAVRCHDIVLLVRLVRCVSQHEVSVAVCHAGTKKRATEVSVARCDTDPIKLSGGGIRQTS
jgi:hypothetical protein